MLSAVATNFASPFFDLRLYTAACDDDLLEFAFSHKKGGWASAPQSVSAVQPEALPTTSFPLSAVAATLVPGEWTTKVYFHPRRTVVAEWDVCAKDAVHAGVTKVSPGAKVRRAIEEETRIKIAEEKRRKEEEERKRREEREEKERQAQAYKKVAVGGSVTITDEAKLERVRAKMNCAAGYEFVKISGGWQCTGGTHRITDAEFDAA